MSELKIDKNVPIPTLRRRYPFREMDIGDSFFVALNPGQDIRVLQTSVKSASRGVGNGFCITTRRVTEDGVRGLRAWRIK